MEFTFTTGELVALMGPSGCGKTTLLNVLARRAATSGAKITGDVLVNGMDISTELFKRITSYVEQEDALIGSLTVQETLHFAAQLSLPRYALGKKGFLHTVEKMCADSKIGRFPRREESSASSLSFKLLVSKNRPTR